MVDNHARISPTAHVTACPSFAAAGFDTLESVTPEEFTPDARPALPATDAPLLVARARPGSTADRG